MWEPVMVAHAFDPRTLNQVLKQRGQPSLKMFSDFGMFFFDFWTRVLNLKFPEALKMLTMHPVTNHTEVWSWMLDSQIYKIS